MENPFIRNRDESGIDRSDMFNLKTLGVLAVAALASFTGIQIHSEMSAIDRGHPTQVHGFTTEWITAPIANGLHDIAHRVENDL